jgi:hypothetical protein
MVMVEEVVLAWVMVSLAGFELRARFYFGNPRVPRDPRPAFSSNLSAREVVK